MNPKQGHVVAFAKKLGADSYLTGLNSTVSPVYPKDHLLPSIQGCKSMGVIWLLRSLTHILREWPVTWGLGWSPPEADPEVRIQVQGALLGAEALRRKSGRGGYWTVCLKASFHSGQLEHSPTGELQKPLWTSADNRAVLPKEQGGWDIHPATLSHGWGLS